MNDTKSKNIGMFHERCKTNPREKAFMEQWLKENESDLQHAINFGHGLLQDLFMQENPVFGTHGATALHQITDDERFVAATVIQWLGTNCGMSFLEEALNKCGFRIVKDR